MIPYFAHQILTAPPKVADCGIIYGMKPIATTSYDFERLITSGHVCVDKTDRLWNPANGSGRG